MADRLQELRILIAQEASARQTNPKQMADLVEALSSSLGIAIAIATDGDPLRIDTMAEGSAAYVHQTAVGRAPEIRDLIARHRGS